MNRTATAAIATLALAAASPGLAQEQVQAPPPAASDPATTAPVQAPAAGPAAAPAAAPVAPEAPPPAPPTEEARYLVQAIDTVCTPLLQGQKPKAVAKAAGYRSTRDGLLLKLPAGKSLTVVPPSVSNPTVCRINVAFEVDQWRPIVETLNTYAYGRSPQLTLLYQGYRPMTGTTTTWSWEAAGPPQHIGLGFTATKKADGSPSGRGVDLGTLVYSVQPAA